MSPFKKIINRLTGHSEPNTQAPVVRGFGKLPHKSEFLHLGAGEGVGRAFADWIKTGHDGWIRRFEGRKRGCIAPTCFHAVLPDLKNSAVTGCIWDSRDGASPPRSFPFTFFVVSQASLHHDWLEQLLFCDHYWKQLIPLFESARTDANTLQKLEDHCLAPLEDSSTNISEVVEAAGGIGFKQWLDVILPSVRCNKPHEYLQFLHRLRRQLHESAEPHGFAARLPLSRDFDYGVQTAVWLKWLGAGVDQARTRLTGLFVPQSMPEAEPALTVTVRPVTNADFQLLTTDARHHAVEDATRMPDRGPETPQGSPEEPYSDGLSLWDWANRTAETVADNTCGHR